MPLETALRSQPLYSSTLVLQTDDASKAPAKEIISDRSYAVIIVCMLALLTYHLITTYVSKDEIEEPDWTGYSDDWTGYSDNLTEAHVLPRVTIFPSPVQFVSLHPSPLKGSVESSSTGMEPNSSVLVGDATGPNSSSRAPSVAPTTQFSRCSVDDIGRVGDGVCNGGLYMVEQCGFDGGDCANCAVHKMYMVGDSFCDGGDYNTLECGWDGGDCLEFNELYPDCDVPEPFLVGDGLCHAGYQGKECGLDGGDCPPCLNDLTRIGDGFCDWKLHTPECDWDGGDCLGCVLNERMGDGICDHEFDKINCGHDAGDCPTMVIPSIGRPKSIAYSPNGLSLACGFTNLPLLLYAFPKTDTNTQLNDTLSVKSIAYSPNNQRLFLAVENSIQVWDLTHQPPKHLNTIRGHLKMVVSLAISPNGETLATASFDNSVKLWNVSSDALLHSLQGHQWNVFCVAFDPNGQTLASGSYDKTIKIWNVDGSFLLDLLGHLDGILSVAFSPNKSILASASFDKTIKIWSTELWTCLATLIGHAGSINEVIFSPDGSIIASASTDGTVKLWDATNYAEIRTLSGHSSAVSTIAFHPLGAYLTSGSADGSVKTWRV